MIKIIDKIDLKSFLVGTTSTCLILGINRAMPFSDLGMLLSNGINIFWYLSLIFGIVPLAALILYNKFKESSQHEKK